MNSSLQKVVLASGNAGKLREFQQLLTGCGFEVVPQSEFDVPDVEETGLSFVENALIKARHASAHTGLPAIADDSGLAVDYLDGEPGIYSARYAGMQRDDEDNNNKLLEKLQGVEDSQRGARFICLLAFMRHQHDPVPVICQGSWHGRILQQAVGDNGFGYDPLFYVEEQGCTSAQLAPEIKNRLSHRGRAMSQLLAVLSGQSSSS